MRVVTGLIYKHWFQCALHSLQPMFLLSETLHRVAYIACMKQMYRSCLSCNASPSVGWRVCKDYFTTSSQAVYSSQSSRVKSSIHSMQHPYQYHATATVLRRAAFLALSAGLSSCHGMAAVDDGQVLVVSCESDASLRKRHISNK